jgi:hypothetical protein
MPGSSFQEEDFFLHELLENKNYINLKLSKFSSHSDLQQRLLIVIGHPQKKIRNRVWRLLHKVNPRRFGLFPPRILWNWLPNLDKIVAMHYLIHFLTNNDTQLFLAAYSEIEHNFSLFEPILIDSLANPDDALHVVVSQMLNRFDSIRFPSSNFDDVLKQLSIREKGRLMANLFPLLRNEAWNVREGALRTLGALGLPEILPHIKDKLYDTDENVRWSLAVALQNVRDPVSIELLYVLLLDLSHQIQQQAALSLGKLLPKLYLGTSVSEILTQYGREDPLRLFHLMDATRFTDPVKRIWRQLDFDPEILRKHLDQSDELLLSDYKGFYQESADKAKSNAFFLLFTSRMPKILDLLRNEVSKTDSNSWKNMLLELIETIQNRFRIQQSTGLPVLL